MLWPKSRVKKWNGLLVANSELVANRESQLPMNSTSTGSYAHRLRASSLLPRSILRTFFRTLLVRFHGRANHDELVQQVKPKWSAERDCKSG